ncbi:hypothetical protein [Staphylococcus saprophyticus]|uniref:hypothetical protein n=1 Tax=Staphylococcus saprophyticus TaxID=29385 RepID=UPI0034C5DD43
MGAASESRGTFGKKFSAYDREERTFKKKPTYEKKRITTSIDIVCKELLMNIVGYDRRKSLFNELTNAVNLYSKVYDAIGEDILDKTKFTESAFEQVEGKDISTINKDVGIENKKSSTKISKNTKHLLDDIVGYDRRKSIYKEVNKAVDLYSSVYQLVGEETPEQTDYILEVIKKYKNNQSK